jgi:hypothetical protein
MSSHKYGLATDWIVGMTTVLANGTIARCSAKENPDLFWALRGAGSNFGIVASYEFATFAAPTQVTYFNMPARWNATTAPGYLTAVENYTKTVMPADLTMRMSGSSYQNSFEGMFFGDVAGLKAALKPLQDKTGLVLQTAVNTTWLKAFEHYANANTDPTTPYSMVSQPPSCVHSLPNSNNTTIARELLRQKPDSQKSQRYLPTQLRRLLVHQRPQEQQKLVVPARPPRQRQLRRHKRRLQHFLVRPQR